MGKIHRLLEEAEIWRFQQLRGIHPHEKQSVEDVSPIKEMVIFPCHVRFLGIKFFFLFAGVYSSPFEVSCGISSIYALVGLS